MMDLYSAVTPKTVQRHFNWMEEHNIDGVFLQHFLTGSDREVYKPETEQ